MAVAEHMHPCDVPVDQVSFHPLTQLLFVQNSRIDDDLGVIARGHQRRVELAGVLGRTIQSLERRWIWFIPIIDTGWREAAYPES